MPVPSLVTGVQDQIVDAVKSINEAFAKIVPMPELPDLPFAGRLPAPEALVESAFTTAGELLESQKQFTIRLLEAATPSNAGA